MWSVCKNIKILAWYSNDFQSQISTVVPEYGWCLMSGNRYHINKKIMILLKKKKMHKCTGGESRKQTSNFSL